MSLRMLALGVGDAFSALHYSSCLALETGGEWLLIDCPHPIRKILREAAETAGVILDIPQVRAVALTHLHADHCSGLEDFAYYCYFGMKKKAQVATHPKVSARLWDGHLAAGMEWAMPDLTRPPEPRALSDYFDITPLSDTEPVTIGPFRIQCRETIHPVPTFALRVEAAGRTLGYSCDTAYDETLIAWLSTSNLIVHETNLGIHTPYEKLAALPEALRARMRLIHYTDQFNLEASVIEPLHQGRLYDV